MKGRKMARTADLCRRAALVALLTLSITPLIPPLAAQEASPEDVFAESIGVEVISIDVVVVDKKGRPVEGLGREDFELKIDGQPVDIANFYAGKLPAADRPKPEVQQVPQTAEEQPLFVVVFLDSFYLTPMSRKRVLEDLPVFIEGQTAAGNRVLLASRDQEVRFLTPFTTDAAVLLKALEEALDLPAIGLYQKTARTSAFRDIRSAFEHCDGNPNLDPCVDCWELMVGRAEVYSLTTASERRAAIKQLDRVVNALSAIEGKKVLLHVSDGIPEQAGVDLFHFLGEQVCPKRYQDLHDRYSQRDVPELRDLVDHANASRVTLYTFEAEGLRNFSSLSAEFDDTRFLPSSQNDMIRVANMQSTLFYLANETGGKAVLNTTDFAPDLEKLNHELGLYYSLGYQPSHPGRGRTHRVSVQLADKKGLEVRYRRSFLHKEPEQRLADKTLGALLFGLGQNPLLMHVEPGATSAAEGGRRLVPLEVRLPWEKLTLLPTGDLRRGRLTLVVAAPGEDGELTAVRKKEVGIETPLDGATTDPDYRVGINVELLPGEHSLAVGVWDELAGTGSFLNVPVHVADAGGGGMP